MTVAEDEALVCDDTDLLRRVAGDQIVDDKNTGLRRPSSVAFKSPNMSVDAEAVLHAHGLDWHFTLKNYPSHSLVRFSVASAKAEAQEVVFCPLSDNPAHAEVRGHKTQGIARRLAAASQWVHRNEAD